LDSSELAGAGRFIFESLINPSAISSHLIESLEIGTEPLVSRCTVLETFQVGFELERRFRRQAVNPPRPMPGTFEHALLAQIGEMLGNLGLWKAKNILEVTNTKWTSRKQMDDPEPRRIAETLVNCN
jgi:hypothetical protein